MTVPWHFFTKNLKLNIIDAKNMTEKCKIVQKITNVQFKWKNPTKLKT